MKEGKGFFKLNEDSIATVREDLAADYKALAYHHSEEVVQILEEYGVADLKSPDNSNSTRRRGELLDSR